MKHPAVILVLIMSIVSAYISVRLLSRDQEEQRNRLEHQVNLLYEKYGMGWNVFREENGILLLASNSTQYPVLDQFPDLHWEPPDRLMNGATYHSKSVTLYWSDDLSATPIEEVDTFNSGKLVSTPSGGGMTDESLQIRYSYSAKARGVNPWRFIHYQSRSMEISRKEAFSLLKTWGIEVPSR